MLGRKETKISEVNFKLKELFGEISVFPRIKFYPGGDEIQKKNILRNLFNDINAILDKYVGRLYRDNVKEEILSDLNHLTNIYLNSSSQVLGFHEDYKLQSDQIYIYIKEQSYQPPLEFNLLPLPGYYKVAIKNEITSNKYPNKLWIVCDKYKNFSTIKDDDNILHLKTTPEYKLNEDLIYVRVQKE